MAADGSKPGEEMPDGAETPAAPDTANYPRMGAARIPSVGLPRDGWRDGYHHLLTMPTAAFIGVMSAAYLAVNAVFACLYLLDPGGLAGARPGNFGDAFFFSVETFGTIGYGVMAPKSLYCNLVMTTEAFVGLFNLAIATGLLFARISRPTARIMFSNIAVVTTFEGGQALMFRAANRRRNLVVEAEVSVTLLRDVVTAEGMTMRRFFELPVLRPRTPLFFLTWQVIHPIDENSPLYGETMKSLLASPGGDRCCGKGSGRDLRLHDPRANLLHTGRNRVGTWPGGHLFHGRERAPCHRLSPIPRCGRARRRLTIAPGRAAGY